MVKLTLILPALLPLLTFVSAHKHTEVHVTGFAGENCQDDHPGSQKANRHDLENDGECEHSWKNPFKSFKVDYQYDRPWNPRDLNCTLDFFSDKKCRALVGSQNLNSMKNDCPSVNKTDSKISARAAKLNCSPFSASSSASSSASFSGTTADAVTHTLSTPSFPASLSIVSCTPRTRTSVHTSSWTECYVPSYTTSATTLTELNYSASPSIVRTTSSSTYMVAVPTTIRSTSSSIWTLQ